MEAILISFFGMMVVAFGGAIVVIERQWSK